MVYRSKEAVADSITEGLCDGRNPSRVCNTEKSKMEENQRREIKGLRVIKREIRVIIAYLGEERENRTRVCDYGDAEYLEDDAFLLPECL